MLPKHFLLPPLLLLLARAPTGEACVEADVIRAYRNVLCRAPLAGGLAWWTKVCKENPAVTELTIEAHVKGEPEHANCLHKIGEKCVANCVDDCVGSDARAAKNCGNGNCVCHRCVGEVNKAATCTCNAGWTGASCTTNIDDCPGKYCGNGSCKDGVNTHSCVCHAGWTGAACTTNIDDCPGQDCGKGVCVDGVNTHSCVCRAGWTGATCRSNIDDCPGQDCGNGSCKDGVNMYTCECEDGWGGTNCKTAGGCTTGFNGQTCQNSGTAAGVTGQCSCKCVNDHSGENCEILPTTITSATTTTTTTTTSTTTSTTTTTIAVAVATIPVVDANTTILTSATTASTTTIATTAATTTTTMATLATATVAAEQTTADPFIVDQCNFIVVGIQKRLSKVRKEDMRWHSDPTIKEAIGVQYNRTALISMLDSKIAAVDCNADPYSPQAAKVDAELVGVEEALASMPPREPAAVAQDGAAIDNSAGGDSLGAGIVVVIILLSLLLVGGVSLFFVHRRKRNGGIPTSKRSAINGLYNTGSGSSTAGFQRGGKNATLPRSRVVGQTAGAPANGAGGMDGARPSCNALYAIPFDETGESTVTSENAEQFVVADGRGTDRTTAFENAAYEYLEVGDAADTANSSNTANSNV